MDAKPIIILGGGLWGGLLFYRLKELHPDLNVKLYEAGATLGGNHTWSFHGSDISSNDFLWLKPFITKSWEKHDLHFPAYSRKMNGSYNSITSEDFHKILINKFSGDIKLNTKCTPDDLSDEAEFIIDARNNVIFGEAGYQKFLGLEVELEAPHNLQHPILMDARVEQKDGYRFIYYLPWSDTKVLVEDTRYSSSSDLNAGDLRQDVMTLIQKNGWKIKKISREEQGVLPIPLTEVERNESHLVINLSGIFQDVTGYSLPDAVRLIEKIVQGSLSFDHLNEIVKCYRLERKTDRQFFRVLNRMLFQASTPDNRYKIFELFYKLPEPLIQRFYAGKMKSWDRARIFIGKPPVPILKAVQVFMSSNQKKKVILP